MIVVGMKTCFVVICDRCGVSPGGCLDRRNRQARDEWNYGGRQYRSEPPPPSDRESAELAVADAIAVGFRLMGSEWTCGDCCQPSVIGQVQCKST